MTKSMHAGESTTIIAQVEIAPNCLGDTMRDKKTTNCGRSVNTMLIAAMSKLITHEHE